MSDPDGVVRHIQHAEEWLRWARSDHRRGDLRAVVLRLLLAEAEIRHAREVGVHLVAGPHPHHRSRRRLAAVGAAVALVLAAATYTVLRPESRHGPSPVGPSAHGWATEPPAPAGAVQLQAGRLLRLGPVFSDAEPGSPGGPPGTSDFRLLPIHGGNAGALPLAPTDLSFTDGPVNLTISGDPGSASKAF